MNYKQLFSNFEKYSFLTHKLMRTITCLFFIVLFAMPVFAKKVEVETAKKATKNLLSKN